MSFFDFLGGGTECCDLLLTNQELNIAIFEFCWERLGKKGEVVTMRQSIWLRWGN
uniref:Uncharacterized protein n=1 Tax=Meloidogyne enterolobii TaxID=390850 RepID=A0A6V7UFV9_MELEN|nr:unnamed protein product [Meloidogyne enterolobii]